MIDIFKSKYFNIFICILLLFTILFNFSSNVYASIAAGTLAGLYGSKKAAELIVFILALATAGVTFNAVDEANKLLENYQLWGQAEPPPNNDWKGVLRELLRFGTGALAFGNIINNIKDFLQDKGVIEGENNLTSGIIIADFDGTLPYYFESFEHNEYGPFKRSYYFEGVVFDVYFDGSDKYVYASNGETTLLNGMDYIKSIRVTNEDEYNYRFHVQGWRSGSPRNSNIIFSKNLPPLELPEPTSFNVDSDSLILNDRDPFDIPEWYQPNLNVIPNLDTKIGPDGINQTIYPGSIDDLLDDLIDNTKFEDLETAKPNPPYQLDEQDGVTIIEKDENAPYPDSGSNPNENTGLIQSIINWIYNIFSIPGDIVEIDFTPITNVSISDKFPFSIPWDLKDSVEMLASEGKAPKWEVPIVTETIVIDMEEFEQIASIMRVFTTLLFVVALIILTRRLI